MRVARRHLLFTREVPGSIRRASTLDRSASGDDDSVALQQRRRLFQPTVATARRPLARCLVRTWKV
jgi:hypothetical protein